jgi:hypothetical protein
MTSTTDLSHLGFESRYQIKISTCCGATVPGLILSHDLEGSMQLEHSKDMSVYVTACTGYNFSAVPVVWKLWL